MHDLADHLRGHSPFCGQCGERFHQDEKGRVVIYSDAACPRGQFCSRECVEDRLADK